MTKNSNDKKKSLKGVVLIMVVTVMFVLIIMLMATLSVVSTAQNRYYTKYEENQAYYTARSALDVFTNNMLNDSDYYAYDGATIKTYIHDNNVTTDKMKQGLALQLDLYTITAQKGDNIKQSDLSTYANTLATRKDEYKNYFGTDSTKVQGSGTADDPEYIEYRITYFPQVSSTSDNYGKMVDTVKTASGTDQIEATIKVEVLDREYNVDQTLLAAYPDRATLLASSDAAEAIIKGTRSKDWMRLKITSTVTFMGTESTAVLVYDTNEPPLNNSSRAITTFGGTSLNNMNIVDGVSTVDPVKWGNNGSIYGNVYTEGDWEYTSSGASVNLTEEEYFYIEGDATGGDGCFDVKAYAVSDLTDKDKRPYVYVGGDYEVANSQIGGTTADEKVDLICNGIVSVNNVFYVNGDVYVKGICDLSGYTSIKINGDLYVDGTLIGAYNANSQFGIEDLNDVAFSVPATITGGVYVRGTVEVGITEIDPGILSGIYTFTTPMDFTTDNDIATDKIDIELPNGVKKLLPSHEYNYNTYYQVDNTGAIITPEIPITAEQKAFTRANDLPVGNYSTKQFTKDDIGITAELKCLQNNWGLQKTENGTTSNTTDWSLNTASEISYVLKAGCGSTAKYGAEGGNKTKYMYISGGGTVNFLLEPGEYWGNIVVADDTQLNIYAPAGNYSFQKFCVWTETIFNAYKDGSILDVGDKTGCNIKVPKINYYFSDGAVITTSNEFFLAGYFYGPGANITQVNQKFDINLNFNGNNIGNVGLTFVGSILCEDLKYSNAVGGVAYINPELADDSINVGDPIHDWTAHQYARN